ncbi:hypothetical protein LINPERPRIM_LOCUS30544 [Linum perenne]
MEAGEVATKKDKRGKTYKAVRRTGETQKCSVCKKVGHNKRAHGSGGVCIQLKYFLLCSCAFIHSVVNM